MTAAAAQGFRPAVHSAGDADRFTMKDDKHKGEGRSGTPSKKDSRQDRLKLALRENLKRRKSQAKGRSDVTMTPSNGDDVAPHDVGGKNPVE
jgi:hypothetical protein